ncbi:MAG: phosphotransferase family protein [Chloroflexota bacterium]
MPHVGWGGDSDAFLVNGALIFRFPRHPSARRALAVEACLLPQLGPRVGLPIPRFRYVAQDVTDEGDTAGSTEGPLFVGYPAIPGAPLAPNLFPAIAADPATRERMAAQLSAFLAGLHTVPIEQAIACGVEAPARSVREQITHRYAVVRSNVYPVLADDERRYLDRLFASFLDAPRHFGWPPTICHGDLTSDHILHVPANGVSSAGAVSVVRPGDETQPPGIAGIIDFGDVCIGDPAGDFVWRFEYGDAFFGRVLDHYSLPVGDASAFARVVGFRYQLMPTTEIAYGLATGTPGYVEEGRRLLRNNRHRFGEA